MMFEIVVPRLVLQTQIRAVLSIAAVLVAMFGVGSSALELSGWGRHSEEHRIDNTKLYAHHRFWRHVSEISIKRTTLARYWTRRTEGHLTLFLGLLHRCFSPAKDFAAVVRFKFVVVEVLRGTLLIKLNVGTLDH